MRKKFLEGLALALLMMIVVPPTAGLSTGQNPNDDFNDNSLDTNKWLVFINADGSVIETNQELQVESAAQTWGSSSIVGVVSNWSIRGDFDIQVDYRLIIWPEQNGIRLGLEVGGPTARGAPDVVERVSAEPAWGIGEVYLTHFSDEVQGITPTDHASGKLRLTRIGSTMSGYYFNGTVWTLIHSAPTSTADGPVAMKIWGSGSTPEVLIGFDNFQVNTGQVVELTEDLEVYTPSEMDPYFVMNITYVRGYPWIEPARQMLRMIAQNLAGLGIEVRLHFVEWTVMAASITSGKLFAEGGYDASFFARATTPEMFQNVSAVATLMHDLFHSSNIPGEGGTDDNLIVWNNTESDLLLDEAVASTNASQIESLLHQWQALFYEEQPAAIIYFRSDPSFGWLSVFGHLAFNMLHPVYGTGVDTPLGQSNPTRAAEAARYVRQAISHTIDRQWAVENILAPEQQPGEQGITPITPAMPGFDSSLQPYSLNLTEARRLLSLAGYGVTVTGSSPISLWVTDSLGRHVGVDPETGNVVIEIPWAYYSGIGTEPQVVYIPWPQGNYTIQVTGTETGAFTLTVTQITQQSFTGVVTTDTTYVYTSSVTSSGAETATPGPNVELENLKVYINALPDDAFVVNPNELKKALNYKIDEVIVKIQNGDLTGAINKLKNDIYPKVTGTKYDYYKSEGTKAWITAPKTQKMLQTYLKQIITEIEKTRSL